MKSKKILSLIISGFIGASIFAASSYAANTPDTTSSQTGSAHTQKDGEIIAILIAVDKNEIESAREALNKETMPSIKKFAHMIQQQHKDNLKTALKLSKKMGITPVDTATVLSLQKDGEKEMANLSSLKGKEFEKAYIDAMVTGHAAVLKMIDDNLLVNVSNPSVKKFLIATRPHIESHLQKSQEIQKTLN